MVRFSLNKKRKYIVPKTWILCCYDYGSSVFLHVEHSVISKRVYGIHFRETEISDKQYSVIATEKPVKISYEYHVTSLHKSKILHIRQHVVIIILCFFPNKYGIHTLFLIERDTQNNQNFFHLAVKKQI